jgi:hypothetical protein
VTNVTSVDWEQLKITTPDGNAHQLFNHQYWYLAPSRISWVPTDRFVSPFQFAMTLHNAKKGEGVVSAMTDLLNGIAEKLPTSSNAKAKAEATLEIVRTQIAADKPSRLRCHFLNYTKDVAEARADEWGWQNRALVPCYLILSSGRYHYADVGIFEKLYEDPENRAIAESYWQTFQPNSTEEFSRLEVLADSALYFPDWENFPEVSTEALIAWDQEYGGRQP